MNQICLMVHESHFCNIKKYRHWWSVRSFSFSDSTLKKNILHVFNHIRVKIVAAMRHSVVTQSLYFIFLKGGLFGTEQPNLLLLLKNLWYRNNKSRPMTHDLIRRCCGLHQLEVDVLILLYLTLTFNLPLTSSLNQKRKRPLWFILRDTSAAFQVCFRFSRRPFENCLWNWSPANFVCRSSSPILFRIKKEDGRMEGGLLECGNQPSEERPSAR